MKHLILSLVMGLGLSAHADVQLSPEESAVVMNANFQKTLEMIRERAEQKGETLRVVSIEKEVIDSANTFMYIRLDTKISAGVNLPFKTIGNIVCGVKYGPLAEVIIDSVYFSPVTPPPGLK